jgi:hypothetical protein
MKITGLYNKKLSNEQYALWLEELKDLNELAVQRAIKSLKTNNVYENCMPTVPQFLSLYRTFIGKKSVEQDYCYVCNNRGYEIIRFYKKYNEHKIPYDYFLYCDCCAKGKSLKINHDEYYSDPISKYFDLNNLMSENKKKALKSNKNKEIKADVKKEFEKMYIALSLK